MSHFPRQWVSSYSAFNVEISKTTAFVFRPVFSLLLLILALADDRSQARAVFRWTAACAIPLQSQLWVSRVL